MLHLSPTLCPTLPSSATAEDSSCRWLDLPAEIRDRVLGFVFEDRVFSYISSSREKLSNESDISIVALSTVSKRFATYQDIVNTIIRSGKIRIHGVDAINLIATSLRPEQRHMTKTLTISRQFLEGVGSTFSRTKSVPGSIGNFKLDVANVLQVYVSISKHSSFARMTKRQPGDPIAYVDWEEDIKNGFVSKVEEGSMLLDACVKNFETHTKRYTGLGTLLSHAASYDVGLQMTASVTFVERQTSSILATVDNARLSTKDWCIRVPLAGGQELPLDQKLSKDCFARGETDVRSLLTYSMPRRWLTLLTIGYSPVEEYKWVYWYQSSGLMPWM